VLRLKKLTLKIDGAWAEAEPFQAGASVEEVGRLVDGTIE